MVEKIECAKCGEKFENNGVSSICSDCKRKSTPKIYFTIATIILLIGFVLGIIIGAVNKEVKLTTTEDYNYNSEEVFNDGLMATTCAYTSVICTILYSVGSICYRLNIIIDKK